MKKIFFVFSIVLFFFSSCVGTPRNIDNKIYYKELIYSRVPERNELKVDGYWLDLVKKTINIPAIVNGMLVTEIGDYVFKESSSSPKYYMKTTKIVIPNTVTTIGKGAFNGINLKEIKVATDNQYFYSKNGVLYSKDKMKLIRYPSGKRGKLDILKNITTIGNCAFYDCQLSEMEIPSGVTIIEESAFSKNKLKTIKIPNGVTSIGEFAFSSNQLSKIDIPSGVSYIGHYAFRDNKLIEVNIPNGVITIGTDAFRGNQLTEITIPNSVRNIYNGAFFGNPIIKATIPASVTTIYADAFKLNENSMTWRNTFHSILMANEYRRGKYELINNIWYYNGNIYIPAIITTAPNAWLVTIDGKSPSLFGGDYPTSPSTVEYNMKKNGYIFEWPEDFPSRITRFYQGEFFLKPGTHTIEVIFLNIRTSGITYTTESMLWEPRYLFEGFSYTVTAELTSEGGKVRFGIERQ